MKKALSILLSLSIIMSVIAVADFSAYALASSGTCGNNVTWSFDSSTGTLTISGMGDMPDYYSSKDSPFARNADIKKIYINNGITYIGINTFRYCNNLTSVTISNGLQSIGKCSFENCTNLKCVNIPDSVTVIRDYAFRFCSALTNITIPNSVTEIGQGAFQWCTNLTNVIISNSLTYIDYQVFNGCSSLTNVTIPDGVTTIYGGAFSKCTNLISISIPYSVVSIYDSVFNEVTNLKYVFYSGNKADWEKVSINDSNNDSLTKAKIHYNSNGTHNWTGPQITKASINGNGKICNVCSVCGAENNKTIIYYPKTIRLSKTNYFYDGEVKKPTLLILDSEGIAIAPSNYKVNYSKGRKAVGKYKVTVKFKGNYSGTKKLTFTIRPKATKITKAEPMNKAFGIKWKKVSKISGYEVQVSTSKKFKKGVKSYTAKASSESAKVSKNIKGNTTYYIRIRTFKTVKYNGKKIKIYSTWSKVKSVTTKG